MAILQDPVMQSILQQAKNDPAALQDHMKNADIRSKVSSVFSHFPIALLTLLETLGPEAGCGWCHQDPLTESQSEHLSIHT